MDSEETRAYKAVGDFNRFTRYAISSGAAGWPVFPGSAPGLLGLAGPPAHASHGHI